MTSTTCEDMTTERAHCPSASRGLGLTVRKTAFPCCPTSTAKQQAMLRCPKESKGGMNSGRRMEAA